jgi:hypothetical protein
MAETTTEQTENSVLNSLLEILKQANNPDACETQNIMLRRLALQGDVVGSRVPAPRNITEIGGYLNLLREMQEAEMESQALAGILGVAGPNPPLGWTSNLPPLAMTPVPNDRPDGSSQSSIPLSFVVRSDFVLGMQSSLKTLHDQGCALPLMATDRRLPLACAAPSAPAADVLPYIGRILEVVPATGLSDPISDILAMVRPAGTTERYRIASRVLAAGTVPVPTADWDALKCDTSSCSSITITGGQFVPIAPALALAGFYPKSPLPEPTTNLSTEWTRLTNSTGLVIAKTKLGDELYQLYGQAEVAASQFASMLNWVWDGSTFVKP